MTQSLRRQRLANLLKTTPNTILVTVIGLVVSLIGSWAGLTGQKNSIGFYVFLAASSLAMTAALIAIHVLHRIGELRVLMMSRFTTLAPRGSERSVLLKRCIDSAAGISVYGSPNLITGLTVLYGLSPQQSTKLATDACQFGLGSNSDHVGHALPFPLPSSALFFFSDKSRNPDQCILIRGNDLDQNDWIYLDEDATCRLLQSGIEQLVDTYRIPTSARPAHSWLLNKAHQSWEKHCALWREYATGRVPAREREEVARTQTELAGSVKSSMRAVDISEVSIWCSGGRCEPVLTTNVNTAGLLTDQVDMRRIFIFEDRATLRTQHPVRAQLREVLGRHFAGGLRVGLAFKTDVPSDLVKDFAIYDGEVAWVETTPGTVHAAGGYFTVDAAEIRSLDVLFDRLWKWRGRSGVDPTLEVQAKKLVDDDLLIG